MHLSEKTYPRWRNDPRYPSLDFKKLAGQGERFSVRVGLHYRAISQRVDDGVKWVWIGSHEEYNKLVG